MAKSKPASGPSSRPQRTQNPYLLLYNSASFLLWSYILVTAFTTYLSAGNAAVWNRLHLAVRWTETLAALEVAHAIFGLVRASPLTTAVQVAGRNTLVWAICRNYPDVAAANWAYTSMVIAWAVADVVRFAYFALDGVFGQVPGWLVWLRYNMFIVLYPPGILSEAWLCYKIIEPSKSRNPMYQYLLWTGITFYVPASYILFSHMFAQRRKMAQKNAVTAKPQGKQQ
ncbi:hypothetical protein MCOR34_004369 [Pyricularia oryzae]|nr:hypothetical protein MCOR34_004369 [Pyricularia oryzae]